MAVRKNYTIRPRNVPLVKLHCPIFEHLHIRVVYTSEIGELSVKVTPAHDRIDVDEIVPLPDSGTLVEFREKWL